MIHPFKNLGIYGYDYGENTFYTDKHLGVDWNANFIDLPAPKESDIVNVLNGSEGGLTLWIRPVGEKRIIRWLHLSKIYVKKGDRVKEGQIICKSGNSGLVKPKPTPQNPTAGRHTHEDHWPNGVVTLNFKDTADPKEYYKQQLSKTFMKITVVANNNSWTTLPQQVATLSDWFKNYSGGKLEVVFDTRNTSFTNIPFQEFSNWKSVEIDWYRKNVTPLSTGQATLFLLNPDQWPVQGSFGTMTWGDERKPVRVEVMALENEGDIFLNRAFHEICHGLFFLTGQQDRVHELLYQDPPRYADLLNLIDHTKLQAKLITIKPESMSQAKIVKSKNNNTVWICYPVPTMTHLAERASLEGIQVPNPIPNSDSL